MLKQSIQVVNKAATLMALSVSPAMPSATPDMISQFCGNIQGTVKHSGIGKGYPSLCEEGSSVNKAVAVH